jgi:hypothetical protein
MVSTTSPPSARPSVPRRWVDQLAARHLFPLLLIGYFERIDSERGIAWRVADSLALYDTGDLRRAHVRGHENVLKRLLVHAPALDLGLWMRTLFGTGTSRGLHGRAVAPRCGTQSMADIGGR